MSTPKPYGGSSQSLALGAAAEALIQTLLAESSQKETLTIAMEDRVLATLAQLKAVLIDLKQLPARDQYQQISQRYDQQLQRLAVEHKKRKELRDRDRTHHRQHLQGDALAAALANLTKVSQQDSTERRRLKREKESAIAPFAQAIAQTDQSIQTLKHYYTTLSKQWQTEMQRAYSVPATAEPLPIIYQDEHFLIIDKSAGLLSVPGRRSHLQDSVLSRLRRQLPARTFLQPVHRLDQATSGVLAIALTPSAHRTLSQQFATQQVHKTYEAILSKPISQTKGTIDLPLFSDPNNRPRQIVDFQQGKPSRTDFIVLTSGKNPRVRFEPHTGRTHQLRVHAAHPDGLNSPILGDILYGIDTRESTEKRLCLHARSLCFIHPATKEAQLFKSCSPF